MQYTYGVIYLRQNSNFFVVLHKTTNKLRRLKNRLWRLFRHRPLLQYSGIRHYRTAVLPYNSPNSRGNFRGNALIHRVLSCHSVLLTPSIHRFFGRLLCLCPWTYPSNASLGYHLSLLCTRDRNIEDAVAVLGCRSDVFAQLQPTVLMCSFMMWSLLVTPSVLRRHDISKKL